MCETLNIFFIVNTFSLSILKYMKRPEMPPKWKSDTWKDQVLKPDGYKNTVLFSFIILSTPPPPCMFFYLSCTQKPPPFIIVWNYILTPFNGEQQFEYLVKYADSQNFPEESFNEKC